MSDRVEHLRQEAYEQAADKRLEKPYWCSHCEDDKTEDEMYDYDAELCMDCMERALELDDRWPSMLTFLTGNLAEAKHLLSNMELDKCRKKIIKMEVYLSQKV